MIKLRWKEHEHNINMLKEFYHSNKYILVEQMKDALLDAINCMEYLEQMKGEEECQQNYDVCDTMTGIKKNSIVDEAIKNIVDKLVPDEIEYKGHYYVLAEPRKTEDGYYKTSHNIVEIVSNLKYNLGFKIGRASALDEFLERCDKWNKKSHKRIPTKAIVEILKEMKGAEE